MPSKLCYFCSNRVSLNHQGVCFKCYRDGFRVPKVVPKEGDNMPYCTITYDPKIGSYDLKYELVKGRNWNMENIKVCNQFIKTMFPISHRAYNPATNIWTLLATEDQMVGVKAVIKNQGFQLKEETVKSIDPNDFFYDSTPTPQIETKESIVSKLEILLSISVISVPFDELKKAYRRKALEFHPDRNNGDGSKMSELNSLWTAFNKI